MFKRKLLTIAGIAFCAAIVTAEPTSLVKKTTSELIEDGAIDSFAFGNEKGKGIVYGKYENGENKVEFGWGNAIADALWLSVYDAYRFSGTAKDTQSLTKAYGVSDGVNIDYVDERPRTTGTDASSLTLDNILGIGLAFNKTFGVQAVWTTDWESSKQASTFNPYYGLGGTTSDLSSESKNSTTGEATSWKYDNVKNYTRKNNIKFNFKGAGIENVGKIALYAKLNNVRTDLDFQKFANDYTESTSYNGTTISETTKSGEKSYVAINPGLELEAGFNLPDWGIVKPKLSFVEDFSMAIKLRKHNTTNTTYTEDDTSKTTDSYTYDVTQGGGVYWTNKLTPKLTMDFKASEKLTLKTQVSAEMSLHQYKSETDTYTQTHTTTTVDKVTGNKTTDNRWTTTGASANPDNGLTNKNYSLFETAITPKIDLGLVYQTIPGKMNVNFGVSVAPGAYTWTSQEITNANVNTVAVTENTDAYGNTSKSTSVTVATPAAETKDFTFNNGSTTTGLNLGATWFFTEDVKLDVYYKTSFANFFGGNTFGVECSVLF